MRVWLKLQALVYDILLWRKVPESDAGCVGQAVSWDTAHGARDVGVVVSGDVPFSAVNVGVVSAVKGYKRLVSYPLKRTING